VEARAITKMMIRVNKIQQKIISFLAGKTPYVLCADRDRHEYFGDRPVWADVDNIVPIQLAYGDEGIRMISICEGVPIYTSTDGWLYEGSKVASDNLYKTRIDSSGFAIKISEEGCCACGKCPTSSKHNSARHCVYKYDSDISDSESEPIYVPGCPDEAKCRASTAKFTKLLSADGPVYMKFTDSTSEIFMCPQHLPYHKHAATKEKIAGVTKCVSGMCMLYKNIRVSGYININSK